MCKNAITVKTIFYFLMMVGVFSTALAQEKIKIAIYPMEADGVNTKQVDAFADQLEKFLKETDRFTIVTRKEIDKVIEEKKFQASCSTQECAIELAKILQAKIIVGLIRQLDDIGESFQIVVKLIDDITGEVISPQSEFHEGKMNKLLKDWPPIIAENLSNDVNPEIAFIEFNYFYTPGVDVYVDNDIKGRTPELSSIKVDPGLHKVKFEAIGYETFQENNNFFEGQRWNPSIEDLNPKTSKESLKRSLIFPGRGQIYTSDINNTKRMTLGYIQMGLTGVGLLGAIPSWLSYSDKKSIYNDAYNTYMDKTTPEDVNFYREAARDKHDEMVSTKTQAIVFTILTVGVYTWSAVDAYINFPYKGLFLGSEKFDVKLGLQENKGRVQPRIQFSYQF